MQTFRINRLFVTVLVFSFAGNKKRMFEVYKCDVSCPGFRDYHARLQTFILFYIDGASFIDIDDDRWQFYLVYEKRNVNGDRRHAIVGYMTVYNYYAYPQRLRPRISQMLVLPPYQHQGHGTRLLKAVYSDLLSQSNVLDITVEDPSENFMRVRDYVDAKNCAELDSFKPENLHKGWKEEMAREAQDRLKINRKQARHVYEILRLRETNINNKEEYRLYRLDVKNRLNKPFNRNKMYVDRLKQALTSEEVAAAIGNLNEKDRLERLQKMYEEAEKDYLHTIERLDQVRQ